MVQALRKLASSVAGQRIIISDLDLAPPDAAQDAHPSSRRATASRTSRSSDSAAQLQIDSQADRLPTLDAASLRPILDQGVAQPNLILDLHAASPSTSSPPARPPLADVAATLALLTQPAALIDSSASLALEPTPEHTEPAEPSEQTAKPTPPPPPASPPGVYLPYVPYVPPPRPHPAVASAPRPAPTDPLTLWYKQLAALHHDNTTLRFGSKTFLDFDAQNALVWVNRPAKPSVLNPPIVVLCNLSSSPVQLSLTAAMKKLDMHGFFLRALLRSDNGMGAQDLDAVSLPPFSVYIGELRR
jgi:alpha-glucosidase